MAVGCRSIPIYHTETIKTILHILADFKAQLLLTIPAC